jgi:hypothetical protein
MNNHHHLSVEEASRLAVTATAADLGDWASDVASDGKVDLVELIGVLDVLRSSCQPEQTAPALVTLSAS